jgi:tripartite-type tricarboxylate transporter receptor subunit TctC
MERNGPHLSRRAFTMGTGALAASTALQDAFAQPEPFPSRPIRIIFPYGAGGGPDITLRMVAMAAEKALGSPVVVENRPGAGGTIGSAQIKQAPADGYTLLQGSHSTHASSTQLYKNLPYDPIADFEPVTLLTVARTFLIVPSSLGVNSIKALHELGRKRGGLSYASPGVGSGGHIGGILFGKSLGIPVTHVPYKSSGETRADLITGRVDFIFNSIHPFTSDIENGTVKVLGLAYSERFSGLPSVPTMAEEGHPTVEVHTWFGIFAPAKTPVPVLDKLNSVFVAAANQSHVKDSVAKQGFLIQTTSRNEFAVFVGEQFALMSRIIREADISL